MRARLSKQRRVPSQNRPFLALGLRLGAAFALSSLYMLVKHCHAQGVPLVEIMFWRQAVSVPLLLGWLIARGQMGQLRSQRLPAHGLRSVMGTIGMFTNFGASILLPLAVAAIFNFTTPLFAVLLTALVLRETVGKWRWLAVALGFAGVWIILQPGQSGLAISPLGAAAGIASGFLIALISLHIRDLSRTEAPVSVVFYFAAFGSAFTLPLVLIYGTPHSAALWLELLGMGLMGTLAQLLLTASLKFGSVASVVVMDYSSLIWTGLFGEMVFHQNPPASTWAGAPLIVAAGLAIAWREHVHHRDAYTEAEAEAR